MTDSESAAPFQAPDPADLAPLFPDYQIEYLIATGGMGAVYYAIQNSLQRPVAIKILPSEFSDDQEFCESFTAEAKAMARVNHPNLIGVFDFGDANGMLFIVMEYVPGQSLHDAAGGNAIDPSEVIRLITGISEGLAHAHEHGILHRDIKPANILLDSEAQPKIGDFGLACPDDLQIKEGEAIYGTPHYTAPEILRPPHHFDLKADVFSLGVMIHELLTGKVPDDDPRPPSAIIKCDPRLDAVVRKATNPNPMLRYSSASEVAEAMVNIANSAAPRTIQMSTGGSGGGSPRAFRAPSQAGGGAWSPQPSCQSLTQPKSGNTLLWVLLIIVVGLGVVFLVKPDLLDALSSGVPIEQAPSEDSNEPGGEQKPNNPLGINLPD